MKPRKDFGDGSGAKVQLLCHVRKLESHLLNKVQVVHEMETRNHGETSRVLGCGIDCEIAKGEALKLPKNRSRLWSFMDRATIDGLMSVTYSDKLEEEKEGAKAPRINVGLVRDVEANLDHGSGIQNGLTQPKFGEFERSGSVDLVVATITNRVKVNQMVDLVSNISHGNVFVGNENALLVGRKDGLVQDGSRGDERQVVQKSWAKEEQANFTAEMALGRGA
ncbi:hypothetical protein Pint_32086 [Pistacia integerrima]|uniref:Uncharacterized protein n=1 Tax=Pistacia integerrima TaxID=434235 RepID=A0ACC0XQJ4_9ROSI|nr:hypothetical protein Pint_32086 [Pistacia integerrima]